MPTVKHDSLELSTPPSPHYPLQMFGGRNLTEERGFLDRVHSRLSPGYFSSSTGRVGDLHSHNAAPDVPKDGFLKSRRERQAQRSSRKERDAVVWNNIPGATCTP